MLPTMEAEIGPVTEEPGAPSRFETRRSIPDGLVLGGYASKRCPMRVVLDKLPPATEPVPESVLARKRMDEGNEFEAGVFSRLRDAHPNAVLVDDTMTKRAQIAATVAAIESDAEVILGGWLPDDADGHRTGRPDILLRAERRTEGGCNYHPVDVKHHAATEWSGSPDAPDWELPMTTLTQPFWANHELASGARFKGNKRFDDWLQLAHYHRMLEAIGRASIEPVGAIIGTEEALVWANLADPALRQTWSYKEADRESALDRYAMEFSFRLDAVAAAIDDAPIVEPVRTYECGDCPWNNHCTPILEASHSVSLVPSVSYRAWRTYRHMGITTMAELASLDYSSAVVADAWPRQKVSLDSIIDRLATDPPDTAISSLFRGEKGKAVDLLAEHGVVTIADVAALDPRVLKSIDWPTGRIADHVDDARVLTWGEGRPHLRRGLDAVALPRHDIEIDIDMESDLYGRCYLWGARVNPGRHCTEDVSWNADGELAEAEAFTAFWSRVTAWRAEAATAGKTISFWCWNEYAEKHALIQGAASAVARGLVPAHTVDDVQAFCDSGEILDLWRLFKDTFVTGASTSLKVAAPLAGFTWHDENPSGADSMLWHGEAITDSPAATAARERLVVYNRDDCHATAAVRDWMRSERFVRVADLGPPAS